MSSDIKITRLPNDINPDVLTRKVMKEKYAVCPFCGNKDCVEEHPLIRHTNKVTIDEREWYGYPDGRFGADWNGLIYYIKHRKELMNWKQYIYHCYKCGCGWETNPFPDKILTEEEVYDIGSLLMERRDARYEETSKEDGSR